MSELSRVLADVWINAAGLLFVFWWVLAFGVPILLFSIAWNVRKGRRALERIAAAVESGRSPGAGGVLGL